jgi:LmbE family N-acetylglucosaminyl deacetylase
MPTVLAIAAHPDDIEFYMAGTLLHLRQRGWETHYMNLSTGHCGSATMSAARTRAVRRREAQQAARLLGATWHAPLCDDLEILYSIPTLRRLAATVRAVNPSMVLTHSPHDYMEDHTETCRLAVSATFCKGFPNFKTTPSRKPVSGDVTVYHAMPHMLRDPLRHRILPDLCVDITGVIEKKKKALAAHVSQKSWLDATQGMDSYLITMLELSRKVGKLSRRFNYAEGWRRHLHAGFAAKEIDPLRAALRGHTTG